MSQTYLLATRTGRHDEYGAEVLLLQRFVAGAEKGRVECRSGGPSHQIFRKASDPKGLPRSGEPVPEGRYLVEAPVWANTPGNWKWSLGEGIGPFQCYLAPQQALAGGRGDFLFHLDSNRLAGYPGSLGCIVFVSQKDAQTFLDWKFTGLLVVDWGLGYVDRPEDEVPTPEEATPEQGQWVKVFRKPSAFAAFRGKDPMRKGRLVLEWDLDAGTYSQSLNGAPLANGRTDLQMWVPAAKPAPTPAKPDEGAPAPPVPVGKMLDPGKELTSAFSTTSIAVGHSEGNRTVDGVYTSSWKGHTDPGNGASNQGTFSVQGFAGTPPEADLYWLGEMKTDLLAPYLTACKKAGVNPGSPLLWCACADLFTQAPLAVLGEGGLLDQIAARTVSPDLASIVAARCRAYIDPKTGKLNAPGFKNDAGLLRADQQRRMEAVAAVLKRRGLL